MVFVAYYPEGAHLHNDDCEEVNDGLVESALDVFGVTADSAFGAILEVAERVEWDVPTAVARCVFYPCTEVAWVSSGGPPAPAVGSRPAPGSLAARVAEFRPRPLPFEPDDLDDAIIDAVVGRKLIWINSISGEREMANLYPDGRNPQSGEPYNKQTKLEETSAGRRVLTFCATEGGFRSVALDTLLEVK